MKLADFILTNLEPILAEWEAFARSIWPGEKTNPVMLRDHASDILRATAWDMKSAQTPLEQSDKSKGNGAEGKASARIVGASDVHAAGRVRSGFDLMEVVAEYRALRASVVRLWRDSAPDSHLVDLSDLTRFNESIDQSLTEAVRSYTQIVDHARQMFLAILGHDLRNPLNSITMSAQALSETAEFDADSSVLLNQISASAAAMGRMISDLLDFTGSGLGVAMPLSPAPMDLGPLCEEVVNEMRAAHPGQTIELDVQGDLAGRWDKVRLRQLVSNILGNAIQHGTAHAPVMLTLRGEGAHIHLAVRNGGRPIEPGRLATIFEPLTRGSATEVQPNRRQGSIGLGLYIAREVVTAHQGTIFVTSSEEDGTVFTVRLPRSMT